MLVDPALMIAILAMLALAGWLCAKRFQSKLARPGDGKSPPHIADAIIDVVLEFALISVAAALVLEVWFIRSTWFILANVDCTAADGQSFASCPTPLDPVHRLFQVLVPAILVLGSLKWWRARRA
jgi:hypothetical protein